MKAGQVIPRGHALQNLFPVYKDGVIRVGDRLKHSTLSPDEKFPIILPSISAFTTLVIRYCHHLTLHGGPQLCLALIRLLFWIVRGKAKVKAFVRSCITCRRFQTSPECQYFAIFVCLCTKAVHLEVVIGYDTAAFIAAFKRFMSRRGPCLTLLSDQGTNFVGADAELRSMHTVHIHYDLKTPRQQAG